MQEIQLMVKVIKNQLMMIFQVKYYSYKLVHCHGEKVENDNILFDIFVGIWYKSNLASQNRPIIQ
jgi:hypothetical protein